MVWILHDFYIIEVYITHKNSSTSSRMVKSY